MDYKIAFDRVDWINRFMRSRMIMNGEDALPTNDGSLSNFD